MLEWSWRERSQWCSDIIRANEIFLWVVGCLSYVQELTWEEGNHVYGKTQKSPCKNPNKLKWNLNSARALCQLIKGECVLSLDVRIVEWLNLGIGFCSLHWSSWELLQKAGADANVASLQLALPRRVWSAKPNYESQGKSWCLADDFGGEVFGLFFFFFNFVLLLFFWSVFFCLCVVLFFFGRKNTFDCFEALIQNYFYSCKIPFPLTGVFWVQNFILF